MLRFGQRIPDDERDDQINDKLLAEKSGILNWLLDGYRTWAETGLKICPSVTAATLEYRDENDSTGMFIRRHLKPDPHGVITAKELNQAYRAWCAGNDTRPWSAKKLGARMTQMKDEIRFEKRQSGTVSYAGITFTPEGWDLVMKSDDSGSSRWSELDD